MSRRALTVLATLLYVAATAGGAAAARADAEVIHDGDRRLELRVDPSFSPAMQTILREWVGFSTDALKDVYGHWPRRRWAISIEPLSASGDDPIPWAQVVREEQDRVEFFITPRASLPELKRAWTGYHELAHLLIPYRGWGDMWFSEGVATYYQNLLQVRAGVIDERELWQKFYEGFERGRRDIAHDGRRLADVSNTLRERGGFMRVYWGGAWYFLQLDTRLRRQSGGRLTLDGALAQLNACCGEERMSAREIVEALDRLNRVYLFTPLYEKMRDETAMPDYQTLFNSLGISVTGDRVQLAESGPGAALRGQIATAGTL